MKKVMFLCLTAILPALCFGQETTNEKDSLDTRWLHGFHFSVSQSQLIYAPYNSSTLQTEVPNLSNSLGFGLGVNSTYQFSNLTSLRGTAGLSFNGGYFTYTVVEGNEPSYLKDQNLLPISLDGSIHGIIKLKEEGTSPYAVLGVTGRLPVGRSFDSTGLTAANGFTSLDLGIGLHTELNHFNIRPELRYSFALQGLNHVRISGKTYMHQVSLVIGLNG